MRSLVAQQTTDNSLHAMEKYHTSVLYLTKNIMDRIREV